jgi:hypothetical protein
MSKWEDSKPQNAETGIFFHLHLLFESKETAVV